ncbi:MAG: carboxy terminal-processing peptidase [Verrucomicrobiae bacterium]|nr:carboxy terminal-processing peptidase [Verrucomicrobiae bacterium]
MNSIRLLFIWAIGYCLLFFIETKGQVASTNQPGEYGISDVRTSVEEARIARLVVGLLERMHYNQQPLNDGMSSKFLDRYLDTLDPARMIFLKSDEEEFEVYRTKMDDMLLRFGDVAPGKIIFNRLLKRYEQFVHYVTNLVATERFTFDTDERILVNRKDQPRPADLDEAKKLWRDRVRYEYLQEKLNKEKPEEIIKIITRRYNRQWRTLREIDSEEVLQLFLSSLAHVYDPHSEYMGRPAYENFNISMKLSLCGIGAVLTSEDGYCKIRELMPGPAMRSGKVKVNDRIVAVAQGTNEFVDVIDWKLSKVVELIRGPKGTEVRLVIIPADAPDPSTRKIVSLVRDEITLENQEAKAKLLEIPLENGETNRIGIIDLPSFYADLSNRNADHKSTTTDVAKLIKKLKAEKVSGIVLDLRRNGGGSLEEAINLTGLFIKEGPVVQVKDSDGTISVDYDRDPNVLYDGPLVVLTSRFSASASEILAAALQDYKRAVVIGDKSTHGKGTVQSLIELNRFLRTTNNLGALKLTIRKFYRINGESTQLKGVTPDIVLPSVNNYAEVGESSLPNAMPWDTIPPSKYEAVNLITKTVVEELAKRSAERVARDRDFAYITEEIERYKKAQADKTVSLNEIQRLKEKEDAKKRIEDRKQEIKKRPAPKYTSYEITLKNVDNPGLPAPMSLRKDTETNKVSTASASSTNKVDLAKVETQGVVAKSEKLDSDDPFDSEKTDEDEGVLSSVDPTMDEARRVLLDLIEVLNKTAVAQKKSESISHQ